MNKKKKHVPVDNWRIGPAIPSDRSHEDLTSSTCAASLTTRLAATDPENFSGAEQAELAKHIQTCSACSAVLADYQQIKELFVRCPSKEPYAEEPESQPSPQIIQMWAEEGVDIVKELNERRQWKMNLTPNSLFEPNMAECENQEISRRENTQALDIQDFAIHDWLFLSVVWSTVARIFNNKMWRLLSSLTLGQRYQKKRISCIRRKDEIIP